MLGAPMSASLTLVTCTRNPTPESFRRVLEGVAALERPPDHAIEYLIIDSTSEPPVASRAEVQEFVARCPWARVIRAEAPGISGARRAGVAASTGSILVWLDDDNVPASDYLKQVLATAAAHPEVTVWGAGRIDVEFLAPVPDWVERTMRPTFQERAHARDEFGLATNWAPFFPVGSGLVTRRAAIERWSAALGAGRYSLAGRTGKGLGSGEDAQIILGAVAAGEAVGVAAGLRLRHLIAASRGTMEYLTRLEFALSASIRIARAECFPHDPEPRSFRGLGALPAMRATVARWRREGARAARFEAARQLGAVSGTLRTNDRPEPVWLRAAVNVLGLR